MNERRVEGLSSIRLNSWQALSVLGCVLLALALFILQIKAKPASAGGAPPTLLGSGNTGGSPGTSPNEQHAEEQDSQKTSAAAKPVEPAKPRLTKEEQAVVQRNYDQAVNFLQKIERENLKVVFEGEAGGGHTVIARISAPSDAQMAAYSKFYTQQVDALDGMPAVQDAYRKRANGLLSSHQYTAYTDYPGGVNYKFVVLTDLRDDPNPEFRKRGFMFDFSFSNDPSAVQVTPEGGIRGGRTPSFWGKGPNITRDRYAYLFEIPEDPPGDAK